MLVLWFGCTVGQMLLSGLLARLPLLDLQPRPFGRLLQPLPQHRTVPALSSGHARAWPMDTCVMPLGASGCGR